MITVPLYLTLRGCPIWENPSSLPLCAPTSLATFSSSFHSNSGVRKANKAQGSERTVAVLASLGGNSRAGRSAELLSVGIIGLLPRAGELHNISPLSLSLLPFPSFLTRTF